MKPKWKGKVRAFCLPSKPRLISRRGERPVLGSRSGDQVSSKGCRRIRQKNRKWKQLAECLSMFLCWKRMTGTTIQTEREEGGGGQGWLMDGVAQQGSEVMRALSELIDHSVLIHFLLRSYSGALRESPGLEAGFIYLCPKIWGQVMKDDWN